MDERAAPAPSRAAPPHRFGPRGFLRPPVTRMHKWPLLLAVTTFPIAVLVGVATATMNGWVGVAIYPSAFLLGAFFGVWTSTVRDGFAGGLIAGWAGFFLGTLVGVPIQYLLNPDAGWVGFALALVVGVVVGAVLGILLGLVAGLGGALGAKASVLRRASRGPASPVR